MRVLLAYTFGVVAVGSTLSFGEQASTAAATRAAPSSSACARGGQPVAPMTARTGQNQTLRSSFLFVRLPDQQVWVGFRNVLEVNGRRVASGARGRAAIEKPGESSLDRWRRLSEESARYLAQSGERLSCVARYSNDIRTEVTAPVRPGEP